MSVRIRSWMVNMSVVCLRQRVVWLVAMGQAMTTLWPAGPSVTFFS